MFENMLQLKDFVYILKELWIENGYFHIEIMILATEMLGGSVACSWENFEMIDAIWWVLMYYFDPIKS